MIDDQVVENPVFMLVGECPGENEEREGLPFVGHSGQLLNRLLDQVGIKREECYVTNVVNERPKANNFGVFYKDRQRKEPTDTLLQAIQLLRDKIKRIQPKLVIALGAESLRALTDLRGIEKWRGSIYEVEGCKIIGTFHPSALMRGGGRGHWYLPVTILDLMKAKEEAYSASKPHTPSYRVVTNAEELEDFFRSGGNTGSVERVYSFDIETTMRGGADIRCIGFAKNSQEGVVVPFDLPEYMPEEVDLSMIIEKWMTSTDIKWVAQNGYGFDINYIKNVWGWEVNNFFFDTMVAHHILCPELPHDLGNLTSFYTRIPYYKHLADTELYKYNAYDAVSTWIVAQKQITDLKKRNLYDLYRNYYHPLLTPLREMNWRGIRIDKEYQKELKDGLKTDITKYQKEIDDTFSRTQSVEPLRRRLDRLDTLINAGRKSIKFRNHKTGKITRKRIVSESKRTSKEIKAKESLNVRSSKQLAAFLYDTLGLPKQTKQGKVTTDEEGINKLYLKTNHEFLKTILDLRRAENMMSKYGKLKTDTNGFVRTTYSFTETGRLKSGRYNAK